MRRFLLLLLAALLGSDFALAQDVEEKDPQVVVDEGYYADPEMVETPTYWPAGKERIDGFDVEKFSDYMVFGISNIDKYFLYDVSLPKYYELFVQSFSANVSDVSMSLAGKSVFLHNGPEMIANFPKPHDEDLLGWARLMAATVLKMRQASDKIYAAHPEQLYYIIFSYILKSLDENAKYVHSSEGLEEKYRRETVASAGFNYRRVRKGIQVIRVFYETPAYYQGFREGDLVTHINGHDVTSLKDEEIAHYLYGVPNSIISVQLVKHDTKEMFEKHLRLVALNPSTLSVSVEEDILKVIIHSFTKNTDDLLFNSFMEVKENLKGNLKGMIVDLRTNGGSDIENMVDVLDLFIEEGVAFKSKGKTEEANKIYYSSGGKIFGEIPIVVLVSNATASSAEIFAASLMESGEAVLVGTPTYGKGTIQTKIDFPNGNYAVISYAEAITGMEHEINNIGVLPVVCSSTIHHEDDIKTMFSRIRDGYFKPPLEKWRTLTLNDEESIEVRDKIRKGCPFIKPSDQNFKFSEKVAEEIISHQDVYRILKDMSEVK